MTCCKCEEYEWDDPQEVVYTDSNSNEYCLFHAPEEDKMCPNAWFSGLVYKRIQDAINNDDKEKECNFSGTIFPGRIIFHQFDSDNPLPRINFDNAIFCKDVDFSSTVFSDDASFSNTHFEGKVSFEGTTFKVRTSFFETLFMSNVLFDTGIYDEQPTVFEKGVDFIKCTFDYSMFKGVKWRNSFAFSQCKIIRKLDIIDCKVYYHGFIYADVENINFINVTWEDDKSLGNYLIQTNDCTLIQRYRDFYQRMKAKYKAENNEYEASQWHIAEKEAQLKLLKTTTTPLLRSIWTSCINMKLPSFHAIEKRTIFHALRIYKLLSGFGENPFQASLCLLFFLFLPFICVGLWEFCSTGFSSSFDKEKVEFIFKTGVRSIPFTKMPPGDSNYSWWNYLLMTFSQLLITFQAALFALAVRNKFRR
jgi:uncharacterized protein YjbI with pentapeptide repeats